MLKKQVIFLPIFLNINSENIRHGYSNMQLQDTI